MKLIKITMSNGSEVVLKNAKIKIKSIGIEKNVDNNYGLELTEIKHKYTFEVSGFQYQTPKYSKIKTKIRKMMLNYLKLEWVDETKL